MPRVCAEIVGRECKLCIDFDECVEFRNLLQELGARCAQSLDSESFTYIVDGRPINTSSRICRDADIKIVRLLRGGT